MRKIMVLLMLALAVLLCCQTALAYDFPTSAEGFPYSPDMLPAEAPTDYPEFATRVEKGQFIVDVEWKDYNKAHGSNYDFWCAFVYEDGESDYLDYDKSKDLFYLKNPPAGFDPEHPKGALYISWDLTKDGDEFARAIFSAETGELTGWGRQYADEDNYYYLVFEADGTIIAYACQSLDNASTSSWEIVYEDGVANLYGNYRVQFPDGVSVEFNRMGHHVLDTITAYEDGKLYTWDFLTHQWNGENGTAKSLPDITLEAYLAPWAAEADMRVYATLADAGIDREALLASVSSDSNFYTFVDGDLEGHAGCAVDGYRFYYAKSGYSDDYPFDELNLHENPESTDLNYLIHDNITAYYDTDGVLTEYHYQVNANLFIFYTANGVYYGSWSDAVSDYSYSTEELLAIQPQPQIVGDAPEW